MRHGDGPPSDWLLRWAGLLPPAARVLDLACGAGRHVRWLAAAGHHVTAVDRDADALQSLAACAHTLVADLEAAPWPLADQRFDAVLVTHYLWRPLRPAVLQAVAPGGLLIYETFTLAQAALGRPQRAEFLLHPGELLQWVREDTVPPPWQVIAFEEGRLPARGAQPARELQRIVARRGPPPAGGNLLPAAPGPGATG